MVRDWDTIRNILEKIEDETLFDFLKEVETEVRFKKTDNRFLYELVWDKKNGDSVFADCELAWTSYKTSVRKYEWLWNGLARQGDRTDEGLTRIHPTQKPVGLIAEILEDYTAEGQTVLDLFGGSGSTLIASEKTGRVCCLMEYERAYVDLIVKRWQDYSGKRAFRESDGRFFDDVKNEEGDETTADSGRP